MAQRLNDCPPSKAIAEVVVWRSQKATDLHMLVAYDSVWVT